MRKRTISTRNLHRLTPPMSNAFEQRAMRTLDELSFLKEEPVVKKKMWVVALVAALILMLAAGAVALVLSNFERVAELEATQGYFDTWPAQERVELVRMLLEEGLIGRDAAVERLLAGGMPEKETEALATRIITEGLGLREDVVCFVSIMEKVKGPIGHWSPEDKAWYTGVLREHGLLGSDADESLNPIQPADAEMTQAETEKIAFDAIAEAYRFDPAELSTYKVGAEYSAVPGQEDEAKWMITFYPPDPKGGHKAFSRYYALIDPKTGEVVSDPEQALFTPTERVAEMEIAPEQLRERDAMYDTKGHHFHWTHEQRALYMPDRFSLPGAEAIPEDEAVRIAWEAVRSHERTVLEALANYETIPLFCPGLPSETALTAKPYWNIVLIDQAEADGTLTNPYGIIYGEINVMLDAESGKVLDISGWGDAFPFPQKTNP